LNIKGDVLLQHEKSGYIEEQKNFNENTAFSFNSHQILNTLAYFLDIWLSEGKSKNLEFGFYSTNKSTIENNTDRTKTLKITIPKEGILNLVVEKKYSEANLLDSVQKYLIDEYSKQYNRNISSELDNDSLTSFLNRITWFFEQNNEKNYEEEIIKKINESAFASNLASPHHSHFVYATLMLALEKKQDEADLLLKFLNKESVENVFLKISAGQEINPKALKYLHFNLTETRNKIQSWLESFLKNKYFSNVKNKSFPELIRRKVAKHSREVKIDRISLEQSDPEKAKLLEVIIKELGDFINDAKPTFLFGELGSGKSTLLAHYYLNDISSEVLPVFIPSTYLKGKILADVQSLKIIINGFINNELSLIEKIFDLDSILLSKREITLIVDGIDELDQEELQQLLIHLLKLSREAANLRIIASGRPIELQDFINFNEWNCLTTLDLTEKEMKLLLKNEAISSGMSMIDGEKDALQRLKILKTKQELLSNATTPLIVCLIRDFLDENISSQTLGDILYEVVKRRLNWHRDDQKQNLNLFFGAYPNILQRENFLAEIAYRIYHSKEGKINEDILFGIINSEILVPRETLDRNNIVNEAIYFFKSNFLHKIGNSYAFQSHQIYQIALGLHLFNQIFSKNEFKFRGAKTIFWRELSYAAAIGRTKGETVLLEEYLSQFIEEILFTSDNTPPTAVLLAEAQISNLNRKFLKRINKFEFRPLKFWGQSDSLVPHAYAYIIKDAGFDGFNWYFNSYLNPIHPSTFGYDQLAALILQFYSIRSQFQLTDNERIKLNSIIDFHLITKSFSCNTLLPTVVLSLPTSFETSERCILLADALKLNIVYEKAQELLKLEWNKGAHKEVINALELACRNKDHESQNAIRLWIELVQGNMPKLILDNCIRLIARGYDELFPVLQQRIGDVNLIAYCRFNALYSSTISDAAAILLYEHAEEKDPILIGDPIMQKSSWFDYKDSQREEILREIVFNTDKGRQSIVMNVPSFKGNFGVHETYLKFFLMSLSKADTIYLNEFIHVVRNLNKFSLSRYPEIRENFIKVLEREEYYSSLKNALKDLDSILRYNSASILIVCNPESETDAISLIIRSAFKTPNDNEEFLRLCMKLNYNKAILDFIYELLDDLTEISRVFAIKLLYHNEYRLNKELLGELIIGLLGNAYFLELGGFGIDDGVEMVIGKDKFFFNIKSCLNSDNFKIRRSAAGHLLHYYSSQLTIEDKALCWLLCVQYSESALIDFNSRFLYLLDDIEFVTSLKAHANELNMFFDSKELLFIRYYEAIKEGRSWKEFILTLLNTGINLDHFRLDHLYSFFIGIGNSNAIRRKDIGQAIREIMEYPAFSQNKEHNYLFPQLAVLAHEFGELNNEEILKILTGYRIPQEELACSLLYRLGYIPTGFRSERGNIEHISLFATNKTTPFVFINEKELDSLLEDGEEIPYNLTSAIESALLMGIPLNDDLAKYSVKGNLAAYFAIVVAFARNSKQELKNFLKAQEIESPGFYAKGRTQDHKAILLKVKEIFVSDEQGNSAYIEALIHNININPNSREIPDLFNELFNLKADFDSKLLPHLFNALLNVPYNLSLNLVYCINNYVLNRKSEEEKKHLVIPLKICLKAVNNPGHERHVGELDLIAWTLSLIILYLDKKTDDDVEKGFLTGLKTIFIQEGGYNYTAISGNSLQFKGGDLFIHSHNIIREIDNKLLHHIIKKGIDSNVPEVSAVCKMISSFAGNY
jgi:hypothetical protein